MDTIPENKKLKLIAAAILIIAAGAVGVFYWQKAHIPLDLSPAAVQAKCLEDVGQMTDAQIIEKINTLAFTTEEELDKLNGLMINYLVCNLRLNPTEETYNKAKENILKIRMTDESHRRIIAVIEAIHPNLQTMRGLVTSFRALLVTDGRESICPDNKPALQLKEACLAGAQKSVPDSIKSEFCNTFCERLDKYSKDTEVFKKEISNFTNWSEWTKDWGKDYAELKPRYSWRSAVAFRFGGEEAALKVCGNLPSIEAVRNDCASQVERFKKLKEEKNNCSNTFKELTAMICQPRESFVKTVE